MERVTKPAVVQVCPFVPAPPTDGGRVVVWHRLKALSQHLDIHLVCPCDEQDGVARSSLERQLLELGLCSVHFVPVPPSPVHRGAKAVGLLRDMSCSRLSVVRRMRLRCVADTAARIAMTHAARTILVEIFSTALPLLGRCPEGTKLLAVEQNVESRLMADLARFRDQSWLRRRWAACESRKCVRAGRKVYPHLARVGFLSSVDLCHFRKLGWNSRLTVLPVILPLPPAPKTDFRSTGRIAFFGTLGFYPNAEGLLWFLRDVWPSVRVRRPDTTCVIPGALSDLVPRSRKAIPAPELIGVQFRPGMDRATADGLLAQCDACVSPIRLGSGIKIKNLIAMGLGVPLVATPESMAGIDVHTGHHCLVAGDAESFASSVIRLLEEEDLRRRLSTGARDWFVRNVASGASVESWLRFIAEA